VTTVVRVGSISGRSIGTEAPASWSITRVGGAGRSDSASRRIVSIAPRGTNFGVSIRRNSIGEVTRGTNTAAASTIAATSASTTNSR